MGPKSRMICGVILIIFVTAVLVAVYIIHNKPPVSYSERITTALNKSTDVVVQEVFDFSFSKAYVFDDCYISGDGFAKRYDLDISISKVKSGNIENIQRIVFVDEKGDFVFEFKCDMKDLTINEKGIVIYPNTVIRRSANNSGRLAISFYGFDTLAQGSTD